MTEVAIEEKPTVYEAWNRVMNGVQAISKDSRNSQQGFNFRGIDAVMNVVGPLLREHGVVVVPVALKHDAERYTSAKGAQMVNRVVEMGFTVIGPRGDSFEGIAFGEAADSGDKAITKAESVALRTFLLQSLMIPTDEPDPDASTYERATPATAARVQAPAAPPGPVGNPESQKARDDLKAVAGEQGWDLTKVAAAFAKATNGQALKDAESSVVEAFTANLLAGTVTLD